MTFALCHAFPLPSPCVRWDTWRGGTHSIIYLRWGDGVPRASHTTLTTVYVQYTQKQALMAQIINKPRGAYCLYSDISFRPVLRAMLVVCSTLSCCLTCSLSRSWPAFSPSSTAPGSVSQLALAFTARRYAIARLLPSSCVRPSVCLSQVGVLNLALRKQRRTIDQGL